MHYRLVLFWVGSETMNTLPSFLLHGYQLHGVEFIFNNPRCALWKEMGLGKTATALTAMQGLKDQNQINRCLVISTIRVVTDVWPEELSEWTHINLTHTLIQGTPKQREKLLDEDTDIHLINVELVPWLVDHLGNKVGKKYDVLILDESSLFKRLSSKRFRALRKTCRSYSRVVELTGSPSSNGLLDLWTQLYLLDQGERLGRTMGAYKNAYFESDYMGWKFTPREGAEAKIHEKVSDICLSMRAEDYLELPLRVENTITVRLPANARKIYKQLEREFVAVFDDTAMTAANAAVLAGKLQQVAGGAVFVHEAEQERQWKHIHDEKIKALGEVIESACGPVLVAYSITHERERILKAFKQARCIDESKDMVKQWNAGEVDLMLMHPQSAGHGLNLQKGGQVLVWFGPIWSLELHQQTNARLHRQGQEQTVFIHTIVCEGTVDELVVQALKGKALTQDQLLDAVRARIGE